jgi:ABC-type glycerol-3-phosphate transport system permease component
MSTNNQAFDQKPARGKSSVFVRRFFSAGFLHVMLVILCFSMVVPFVWMLLTSVKSVEFVGLPDWVPAKTGDVTWLEYLKNEYAQNLGHYWHLDNYREVFDVIPFARYYWNSIFVAAWVTFLQVFTSSLAAFSFSRINWPGRNKVFLLYLGTMMLPGLVMMIPNFQIMISLGLYDTFAGLILPGAFTAFGTFLLRQFMMSIPTELDEAAEIDGASKWRVYWDVILPLSRPGLIVLTIFTFMGNYHSLFWPLVMLRSEFRYTLPIGLLSFSSTRGQSTHLLMAAATMMIIPLILLFISMQKYLVKGIQLGAVKG